LTLARIAAVPVLDGPARFETLIVLIGSLVKDVDRPGVERVGAVGGGDANAV
jgi:hypothetical protein